MLLPKEDAWEEDSDNCATHAEGIDAVQPKPAILKVINP